MESRKQEFSGIKSAYVEITDNCNFRCEHCFGKFGENNNSIEYNKLIYIVDKLFLFGVRKIIISGGEPTLHKRIIEIIKMCLDKNMYTVLATNGYHLQKEIIEMMKSNNNLIIQISLDSVDKKMFEIIRGENTYDNVMNTIWELINNNLVDQLVISSTVFSFNISVVKSILDFCKEHGIKRVGLKKLRLNGRAKDSNKIEKPNYDFFYGDLLALVKKYKYVLEISGCADIDGFNIDSIIDKNVPCQLGENIRIDTKGNIYPCQMLTDTRHCLGNIFNDYLCEIIEIKLREIIKLSSERVNKIDKCSKCKIRHFCWGGCMAQSLDENNDIYTPYPYCDVRYRKISNLLNEKNN